MPTPGRAAHAGHDCAGALQGMLVCSLEQQLTDLVLAIIVPARGRTAHAGPDGAQGTKAMLEVVQGR